MKGKVFKFIVSDLIEELERDAPSFLTEIYTRELKLMQFMKGQKNDRPILPKEDDRGKDN